MSWSSCRAASSTSDFLMPRCTARIGQQFRAAHSPFLLGLYFYLDGRPQQKTIPVESCAETRVPYMVSPEHDAMQTSAAAAMRRLTLPAAITMSITMTVTMSITIAVELLSLLLLLLLLLNDYCCYYYSYYYHYYYYCYHYYYSCCFRRYLASALQEMAANTCHQMLLAAAGSVQILGMRNMLNSLWGVGNVGICKRNTE